MPNRVLKSRKLRKLSIGDMRECISLEMRELKPPLNGGYDMREQYTVLSEEWAQIDTIFSGRYFDGVDIEQKPSHLFTIRFRDDVTTETRIRYNDVLYKIIQSDNFEMRNEYLQLFAVIQGDDELDANQ